MLDFLVSSNETFLMKFYVSFKNICFESIKLIHAFGPLCCGCVYCYAIGVLRILHSNIENENDVGFVLLFLNALGN
jgi:hypothetical protein